MEISIAKRQAYSEVYEIINLLDIEYIDKIPKKILRFFDDNRDKSYRKNINPFQDISTQNLKKDTIVIFSMLNLKYFANQEEKDELKQLYIQNKQNIETKYSYENIFKEDKLASQKIIEMEQKTSSSSELIPVLKTEENIFKKIIHFIIKIFNK